LGLPLLRLVLFFATPQAYYQLGPKFATPTAG
jgi:hypothetical protein